MSRIRYIKSMNRYYILFEDGSKGWYSQRAADNLFPDRDWNVVKENTSQWFYI